MTSRWPTSPLSSAADPLPPGLRPPPSVPSVRWSVGRSAGFPPWASPSRPSAGCPVVRDLQEWRVEARPPSVSRSCGCAARSALSTAGCDQGVPVPGAIKNRPTRPRPGLPGVLVALPPRRYMLSAAEMSMNQRKGRITTLLFEFFHYRVFAFLSSSLRFRTGTSWLPITSSRTGLTRPSLPSACVTSQFRTRHAQSPDLC